MDLILKGGSIPIICLQKSKLLKPEPKCHVGKWINENGLQNESKYKDMMKFAKFFFKNLIIY